MKYLSGFLKPYWKQFIIGPFFKLMEAILELTLPVLMARIIDIGIANGDREYILRTGLLMIGIAAVGLCCALICQYSASIASQGVGTKLRSALFSHINGLSYAQLDRFGTQTLSNRITYDVNQFQNAVAMFIRLVIRAPFICIGSIIAAMLIDFKLSVIIFVAVPLFTIVLFMIMKITFPLYRKLQKKLDGLALLIRENLSGVRVIRAFVKEGSERNRFEESNADYARTANRVGLLSALLNPATTLLMNAAILAIIWFGGFRVQAGEMKQGEVIAFINYISQILTVLIVTANLVILFTRAYASTGRIKEVLTMVPDMRQDVPAMPGGENSEAPAVSFQNVSFSYTKSGEMALQNLNFTLEQGKTLGIIGLTGSGKTTLIQLIPRFYDATAGTVEFFGKDVRAYDLHELRRQIALVPQKIQLFSGTIFSNVRFGNPDATLDEVKKACETAQAAEFIESKTDGYHAKVERGGRNLSGGQRQRLAVARALVRIGIMTNGHRGDNNAPVPRKYERELPAGASSLRKAGLLILDDASSALDFATEAALYNALRSQKPRPAMMIISQRVSSVRGADQILVLEDGKMAGLGVHKDLLQSCMVYRELYALQSGSKS